MLKKYLKRWLPDPSQLKNDSGLARVRDKLMDPLLWHLNHRAVARGVAIGLLIAFVPLPVQMLIAATLAILLRCNLPMAVLMTWITNPVTFLPINIFIYQVGKWVTQTANGNSYRVTPFDFQGQTWQEFIHYAWQWFAQLGKPFLVGLPIVAICAAILGYILTNLVWRGILVWQWHRRKSYGR